MLALRSSSVSYACVAKLSCVVWIFRTCVHSNRFLDLAVRVVNDPKEHILLLYINPTFEGNWLLAWKGYTSAVVFFVVCK